MVSETWWLRFILITAAVLTAVAARYVESQISSETLLEPEDEDDVELEEVLTDFYDDLIEEYVALKKELNLERMKVAKEVERAEVIETQMDNALNQLNYEKSRLDEKINLEEMVDVELQRIKLEEKRLKKMEIPKVKFLADDDYDYMSDAAALPEPESAGISQGSVDGTGDSVSWSTQNGSVEDSNLAKSHRESLSDMDPILRNKELRLKTIVDQILELRGGKPEVNSTIPSTDKLKEILDNNKITFQNVSSNSYIEKVQSFYPSCDIPKNTDEELWTESDSMNLLFDVKYPSSNAGIAISVISAKLRLYKISQVNVTGTTEPTANVEKNDKALLNQYGVLSSPGVLEDDRPIRVSVYWYTRTLRKNRVKRKLMDSQMFNTVGNEWIELNVRTAVRAWKDYGRNFGLVVTVEDEDNLLLPAEKYVHAMNCSKDAVTVKPLPLFLIDKTKAYMNQHGEPNQTQSDSAATPDQINVFPYLDYPILDVCTVEVPISEASSFIRSNGNAGYSLMVAKSNTSTSSRPTQVSKRPDETRTAIFNTVGLGSPAAGTNRNNLVPILTKSDVVTIPEDLRMKNDVQKPLSDRTEAPRRRHSRKHASSRK